MASLWKEVLTNAPKECKKESVSMELLCYSYNFCVSPGENMILTENCDLLQHHFYFTNTKSDLRDDFPPKHC